MNATIRKCVEYRHRSARPTLRVLEFALPPLIALMFLTPSAFGAPIAFANDTGSSRVSFQSDVAPLPTANGASNGTGVSSDADTVYNVYDELGYTGNFTVYPTDDTHAFDLPPVSLPGVWENTSNDTYTAPCGQQYPVENAVQIATPSSDTPFFQMIGHNIFFMQFWTVATGGSQEWWWDDAACGYYGEATTQAIQTSETITGLSNLPATNASTSVFYESNTGTNVTQSGDYEGQAGNVLNAAISVGLDLAAAFVDPEIGVLIASVSAYHDFTGLVGALVNYPSLPTCSPGFSNSGTLCQYGQLTNGSADDYTPIQIGEACDTQGSCGSNVYTQTLSTITEINGSALGDVASGEVAFRATNEMGVGNNFEAPASQLYYIWTGAQTPYLTYQIQPSVGVGGYVHLWAGGPSVPQADVVIQQQYGATTFQSNYESPDASTGCSSPSSCYHVFLEPLSGGANTYTQVNAYLKDPMGTTDDNLMELPKFDWTHEGTDVENVSANLSGGQLNGTITGLLASGGSEKLGGATVELCNVQGCISTLTNSAGSYTLQFPVAGTSSDEDSLTVSDGSSWTASEITGLELPVDKYSLENVALEPSSGGCVAQGTPILTPAGYVPVQNLKSGQTVVEYDFATNSLVDARFVSANVTPVNSLVDVDHGLLYLTPTDQPIYIENNTFVGWLRDPQNLTSSDRMYDPVTSSWIQVTSITTLTRSISVYDVVTGGFNNFIANGVLLDKKG